MIYLSLPNYRQACFVPNCNSKDSLTETLTGSLPRKLQDQIMGNPIQKQRLGGFWNVVQCLIWKILWINGVRKKPFNLNVTSLLNILTFKGSCNLFGWKDGAYRNGKKNVSFETS